MGNGIVGSKRRKFEENYSMERDDEQSWKNNDSLIPRR